MLDAVRGRIEGLSGLHTTTIQRGVQPPSPVPLIYVGKQDSQICQSTCLIQLTSDYLLRHEIQLYLFSLKERKKEPFT